MSLQNTYRLDVPDLVMECAAAYLNPPEIFLVDGALEEAELKAAVSFMRKAGQTCLLLGLPFDADYFY
jgi:hypothetical protein